MLCEAFYFVIFVLIVVDEISGRVKGLSTYSKFLRDMWDPSMNYSGYFVSGLIDRLFSFWKI